MLSEQPKKSQKDSNYNFNLRVIIVLVVIEVFILSCISFVKIYLDKKDSVLNRMRDEMHALERIFIDDLDYSSFILSQMADLIKSSNNNNSRIDNILSHYSLYISDRNFFGWRGLYWLDKRHEVKNTNPYSSIIIGTDLQYLSNIRLSKISPGKVFFSSNPNSQSEFVSYLDLALGVNGDNGEYMGTILLEIETEKILEDIEIYKRNNYTEYAIVDHRMNIVASYPIHSDRIFLAGRAIIEQRLLDNLSELNFFSDNEQESSYIKMFSGVNFLAKKIKNKPYALIVSLDPHQIKTTFTKKVSMKFLEIAVLASLFLVIVLVVYKRETWLRARSEKASAIATKAMIAKSDFLSYTAHEIRSPLGFILTGSEIMLKKLFGPIPKEYEDYVSGIYHNSRLILDFINDILDEKRIASGNFRLRETVCNLSEIIEKAIKTNITRFHARKIVVKKEIEENLPFVFGDERKILQILNNLISNSYKYSLDNTNITIIAKMSGLKLKIIIKDEGIGMSGDDIEIAMTKYGTVHKGVQGNFIESYGLGLPIVLMLVKAHDATFDIKSELGKGTETTIIFPEKRTIGRVE